MKLDSAPSKHVAKKKLHCSLFVYFEGKFLSYR